MFRVSPTAVERQVKTCISRLHNDLQRTLHYQVSHIRGDCAAKKQKVNDEEQRPMK